MLGRGPCAQRGGCLGPSPLDFKAGQTEAIANSRHGDGSLALAVAHYIHLVIAVVVQVVACLLAAIVAVGRVGVVVGGVRRRVRLLAAVVPGRLRLHHHGRTRQRATAARRQRSVVASQKQSNAPKRSEARRVSGVSPMDGVASGAADVCVVACAWCVCGVERGGRDSHLRSALSLPWRRRPFSVTGQPVPAQRVEGRGQRAEGRGQSRHPHHPRPPKSSPDAERREAQMSRCRVCVRLVSANHSRYP